MIIAIAIILHKLMSFYTIFLVPPIKHHSGKNFKRDLKTLLFCYLTHLLQDNFPFVYKIFILFSDFSYFLIF